MQAQRQIIAQTPSAVPSQVRARSRLSVTVAVGDAEPLRRVLFVALGGRIQRLVKTEAKEPGSLETLASLHIVLDREAVDEAMHLVMSSTRSAQFGRVQPVCAPNASPAVTRGS
jgi:hypothetical protein